MSAKIPLLRVLKLLPVAVETCWAGKSNGRYPFLEKQPGVKGLLLDVEELGNWYMEKGWAIPIWANFDLAQVKLAARAWKEAAAT